MPKRNRNKPDQNAERIAALEVELQQLRASSTVHSMARANKRTSCTVGGLEVDILPLPPLEWARATRELPSFLLVYAAKSIGGDISDEDLGTFVETVRGWLRVCARVDAQPITEAQLERLSVPEASVAATVVSAINGFDDTLREFFRRRAMGDVGHGSSAVRVPPERSALERPN